MRLARTTIIACLLGLAAAGQAQAAVVQVKLTARHEMKRTLMSGIRTQAWTFNGSIPGPVIRVRLGDEVQVTLHNADLHHGHSLDFHASEVDPMTTMATVAPGKTKTFSFTPKRPGVFMYHCGTAPVLQHVGMGMYGMIIVDPPQGRAPAQELMLVQSEFYGPLRKGVLHPSLKSMLTRQPVYTAFNGSPFRYLRKPIKVTAGQPVRIYLVDAGPSLGSAFHVVGEIFDAMYPDGGPAQYGSSVSTGYVPAGGGAIFELTFDNPGTYTFLTHELGVASLGAIGRIVATAPPPGP